ncbi:MAG: hypothetical protein IID36_13580, partial [Planctomycetes bacterium]|nr:hypothetical protein [Planctomycetota bacterium]
ANTIEFDIYGNVAGDITIATMNNIGPLGAYDVDLKIGGNLSGLLDVDSATGTQFHYEIDIAGDVSGTIELGSMFAAWVRVGGDLTGTYKVTEVMARSCMVVNGGVTATSLIDVADMTSVQGDPTGTYPSGIVLNKNCNGGTCEDTAGSIILHEGLRINQTLVVYGTLASSADIDLKSKPMAGLILLSKGGAGDIINGGTVTQSVVINGNTFHCEPTAFAVCDEGNMTCDVILGDSAGDTFSGQASFSGVADDGEVHAEDVDGSIKFVGDMAGTIDINGTLGGKGNVYIVGNLTSTGTLSVGEDVKGDIDITGDHDGTIAVTGSLAGLGRILVDGPADGGIVIGEENVALTLINLAAGLGSNGTIVINDSQGNFNANGTIHSGPTAIGDPPVGTKFDGCIRVKDNGSGLFGSLGPFARIEVVGCLAHDIDICIDGDDNGKIRLAQMGCSPTYTWGCPGACP